MNAIREKIKLVSPLAQAAVPPHDTEIEKAVLGSIMLHNELLDVAMEIIEPDCFYSPRHQRIYAAIVELMERKEPVDLLTLSNLLKPRKQLDEVGGVLYLSELADRIPSVANAESYMTALLRLAQLRKIGEISARIHKSSFCTDNPEELIDKAEREVMALRSSKKGEGLVGPQGGIKEIFQELEALYVSKEAITGLGTGLDDLDKATSGLQKKDLIILAARPSMGKTALALCIAEQAAVDREEVVAFFSVEMGKNMLLKRAISARAKVRNSFFRSPDEKYIPKIQKAAGEIARSSLYFDDRSTLSVSDMRSACRRLKIKEGREIGLIVVDYLQLMHETKNYGTKEQEISAISRGLKAIAKEFDCPVLALSQLNRSLEKRPDRRPIMSDLRDSGGIEQDADVILFVYRDQVYNEDTEDKGIAELIIGKQRNGPIYTVRSRFFEEYTRFDNLYPH